MKLLMIGGPYYSYQGRYTQWGAKKRKNQTARLIFSLVSNGGYLSKTLHKLGGGIETIREGLPCRPQRLLNAKAYQYNIIYLLQFAFPVFNRLFNNLRLER